MNQPKEFSPKETNFRFLKNLFIKTKVEGNSVKEDAILIKKGNKIITNEFCGSEFLFIRKGKIEIYKTSVNGNKRILGIFNSGTLLENVTSSGLILCSAAITLMDSELVLLTKDMVSDILNFS